MHYYPHNIPDFNNATRHLTRVERSVYRDAIERYYDTEQPFNVAEFDALANRLMCKSEEELDALRGVLADFFVERDGFWHHDRCDSEIAKYRANADSKRKAGLASARARQQKSNTRPTRVDERSSSVEQTKNQEPRTINQEPISSDCKQPVQSRKRKTKLPDGFDLNYHRRTLAVNYWKSRDRPDLIDKVRDIFDQFTNDARAKGKAFLDWDAAWTTWYANALKFERAPNGQGNGNYKSKSDRADEALLNHLSQQ